MRSGVLLSQTLSELRCRQPNFYEIEMFTKNFREIQKVSGQNIFLESFANCNVTFTASQFDPQFHQTFSVMHFSEIFQLERVGHDVLRRSLITTVMHSTVLTFLCTAALLYKCKKKQSQYSIKHSTFLATSQSKQISKHYENLS